MVLWTIDASNNNFLTSMSIARHVIVIVNILCIQIVFYLLSTPTTVHCHGTTVFFSFRCCQWVVKVKTGAINGCSTKTILLHNAQVWLRFYRPWLSICCDLVYANSTIHICKLVIHNDNASLGNWPSVSV